MWNTDFTQIERRLLLLIGQFIALLLCIGYIDYIYTANILPDKQAKKHFHQTNCFLISKKLSSSGHLMRGYRADFLISYNVKGVQYNRWVSGNGLNNDFTRDESDEEDMLSQYQPGGTYPCWYNPDNPQYAILVLRHNWFSTFPLMVPAVVIALVCYYFFKNLFYLLSTFKAKRHPRKRSSTH